jgi:glucose-1-phosphate thymidylyltransferase
MSSLSGETLYNSVAPRRRCNRIRTSEVDPRHHSQVTSTGRMPTERAVVLARGLGSRMRAADPAAALSDAQRRAADAGLKGMMPIGGRPFLDYVLSALADAGILDAALVVAPDHELVRRHYQLYAPPSRLRVSFAVQPEPHGTADALLAAEAWTAGHPFLAMNADNLYPAGVLGAVASLQEPGLPAFRRGDLVRWGNIRDEQVRAFALLEVDGSGYLTRIVEKPAPEVMTQAGDGALLSMNCWRFDNGIFQACRDVPRSERGEFELPQAVMLAIRRGMRFKAIPASGAVLDLSRRGDAAEISRRLSHVTPRP